MKEYTQHTYDQLITLPVNRFRRLYTRHVLLKLYLPCDCQKCYNTTVFVRTYYN